MTASGRSGSGSYGAGGLEPEDYDEGGATGPTPLGMSYAGSTLDSHVLNARPRARLSEDEQLAREVARRRQLDLERRSRIFDAKRRTIGLDLEALEQQKADNLARRQREKAEAMAGDREMQRTSNYLNMLEIEKQRTRREHEKASKEFNTRHLNYESRREFDLNDPHANRKGLPARLHDEDPRCGPSSMQKFGGEDLTKQERVKQQQLATVHFIEQQRFEKAAIKAQEEADAQAFAREVAKITDQRTSAEDGHTTLLKDREVERQQENLRQAMQNAEQKRALAELEMEQNARELDNHSTDPFLQETANHYTTDGRVRRDAFKGSTRPERTQVAQNLLEQADADQQRRHREQLEDRHFAQQQEQTRKQMLALERERSRMKRAMAEQVKRENQALQADQKNNLKRLDQLYTNEYRPEFFEQFGTGCR